MRIVDQLLSLLFPAPCLGCQGVEIGPSHPLGLCTPCRARLKSVDRFACKLCLIPLPKHRSEVGPICIRCLDDPPPFDRLYAGWLYQPPFDGVVCGLKFGRLPYLGRHLARQLFAQHRQEITGCRWVVPVPLHWRREILRGYNQAELIARPLANLLNATFVRALRKTRKTVPQASLPRAERRHNVHDAFQTRMNLKQTSLRDAKILLVDDISTTGATLSAASQALVRAGASSVIALCAGITPLGGSDTQPFPEASDSADSKWNF